MPVAFPGVPSDGAFGRLRSGKIATIKDLSYWPGRGGAGLNSGGLSSATQAVSGALVVARKDANTCCAQGDETVTAWPTPGNSRSVELGSVCAASRAQLVGVTASKLPASSRVGIVLGVAARCSAGAFGIFHSLHWSAMYGHMQGGREHRVWIVRERASAGRQDRALHVRDPLGAAPRRGPAPSP